MQKHETFSAHAINNCLESLLTLLARGESFFHGSDSDGVPITSDYLEAVFSLGQDDIQLLMPESWLQLMKTKI